MKLTRDKLKQIIKEELKLLEADRPTFIPGHDIPVGQVYSDKPRQPYVSPPGEQVMRLKRILRQQEKLLQRMVDMNQGVNKSQEIKDIEDKINSLKIELDVYNTGEEPKYNAPRPPGGIRD
jgi:hypothetical protein